MNRLRARTWHRHLALTPKVNQPKCGVHRRSLCKDMEASHDRALIHLINEVATIPTKMHSFRIAHSGTR